MIMTIDDPAELLNEGVEDSVAKRKP